MTVEQNLNLIQKKKAMFDIIIETLVPYFQQFLLLTHIYTD